MSELPTSHPPVKYPAVSNQLKTELKKHFSYIIDDVKLPTGLQLERKVEVHSTPGATGA